jgi:hypothetical protein
MYGPYFDITYDFMLRTENGELEAEAAADAAIQQLQVELGDAVIVR